jgi:hypothetical protein
MIFIFMTGWYAYSFYKLMRKHQYIKHKVKSFLKIKIFYLDCNFQKFLKTHRKDMLFKGTKALKVKQIKH